MLDRHQKDVVTAVRVFLRQNSDVGNENETRIADFDCFLLDRIPPLRGQEKQTALASAVGRFAQLLAEIKCRVIRFPFVFHRDVLPVGRDARNVLLVEVIWHLEQRMFEFSVGLADQMIDLRSGDAADFEFDRAQSP